MCSREVGGQEGEDDKEGSEALELYLNLFSVEQVEEEFVNLDGRKVLGALQSIYPRANQSSVGAKIHQLIEKLN